MHFDARLLHCGGGGVLLEEVLDAERRHASRAGGRDRLPPTLVLHVAGGEHAVNVRRHCAWVRDHVPVGVHVYHAAKKVTRRLVS
jgi:hypothetical protein